MARTVLLDFDGTLSDSRPGILASHAAALRALGHTPDPSIDLTPFIGPPIADALRAILPLYGDDRVAEGVAAYRAHYGQEGLYQATLYDGVAAVLERLAGAGLRLFLATAKRTDFARRMLDRFGLLPLFDGVYGAEEGGLLDEKPALLAHILAREGLDPADTVMVGDRRYDILGAQANGVAATGVLWGYGGQAELRAAGAPRLIRRAATLYPLLAGPPVREAAAADLPAVLDLYRAFGSWRASFDAAAAGPVFAQMAQAGVTLLVAESEGRVTASCTLAVVPNLTWEGRPYAVVENVVTDPTLRRGGHGHAVLAEAEARAWAAGCHKVILATGSTDAGVLAFYDEAGFERGRKTLFEMRVD